MSVARGSESESVIGGSWAEAPVESFLSCGAAEGLRSVGVGLGFVRGEMGGLYGVVVREERWEKWVEECRGMVLYIDMVNLSRKFG